MPQIGSVVGEASAEGRQALNQASSFIKRFPVKNADKNGTLDTIRDRLLAMPGDYKSKKWSIERFNNGLRHCGLNATCAEIKKSGTVKKNEAFGKGNPD